MTSIRPVAAGFQTGDTVVLSKGTYQGTHGVFRHFGADPNWAEIEECGGKIMSHPVAWMDHAASVVAA